MAAIQYLLLALLFCIQSCAPKKKEPLPLVIEAPSEIELFKVIQKGERNPQSVQLSYNRAEDPEVFYLQAKNLPHHEIYHLAKKGHLGQIQYISSFQAENETTLQLSVSGLTDYYLVSDDHATVLHVTVDPLSYKATAKEGFTVELNRIDEGGEMFTLVVEGFEPSETINYRSISGNEVISTPFQVDATGKLTAGTMPGTIGSNGGIATIEITRESGETITLDYPWGTALGTTHPQLTINQSP